MKKLKKKKFSRKKKYEKSTSSLHHNYGILTDVMLKVCQICSLNRFDCIIQGRRAPN